MGEVGNNAFSSSCLRLRSKMHDEASDFRDSIEEQEKEAVLISCTQPEEIQKATKETRAKSKEAPAKDAVNNEILVNLVPDSQQIITNCMRTALEHKSTKKASEASQEKDEGAGLAALAGMHRTIKQQTELIQTMYKEIKGLREL